MKTKKVEKKLTLKKETIAELQNYELEKLDKIKGGTDTRFGCDTYPVYACPTLVTLPACYTEYPTFCPETQCPTYCPTFCD